LILFERRGEAVDFSGWGAADDVFISAVTVSELLMGVHRADTHARRQKRLAFVESVINRISALSFTSEVARIHAELTAHLMAKGEMIGAHDLIIAATAQFHGLALLTANSAEFSRLPNLQVLAFKTE
jgi:predicted nucleic acid-binding protein